MSCFQSRAERRKLRLVYDIVAAQADYVSHQPNTSQLLPQMCCGFAKSFKDVEKTYEEMCLPKNKPEAVQYAVSLVAAVATEVVDLGCGRFNKIEHCTKQFPALFEEFDRLWKQSEVSYHLTPLIPLLRIVERIDQDTNIYDD